MSMQSRRTFIQTTVAAACALPILMTTKNSIAQTPPTAPVAPTDPMAIALGYVDDATKVDVAKYPRKAGPEGAKMLCSNCILYAGGDIKIPGKDGVWGKCNVIASGLVNSNGWCNSWAPKAA
jgi:hypothetical protein